MKLLQLLKRFFFFSHQFFVKITKIITITKYKYNLQVYTELQKTEDEKIEFNLKRKLEEENIQPKKIKNVFDGEDEDEDVEKVNEKVNEKEMKNNNTKSKGWSSFNFIYLFEIYFIPLNLNLKTNHFFFKKNK